VTLITVLGLLIGLALPLASASGQAERRYVKYAKVRDQLIGCSIDRGGGALSDDHRRRCTRLQRLYRLYSFRGSISTSFIRCRTSTCPPAPLGVPDPRGAPPSEAVVVY
jgi:hypothetical protein